MKTAEYVFATNNPGKVKEIHALCADKGIKIYAPGDFGLRFEGRETGDTFEHNALEKAHACARLLAEAGITHMAVLSDDSGLAIDALGGEPGVDSANYLGRDTPYTERNRHILHLMRDVPEEERGARFICVIACVLSADAGEEKVLTASASIEGRIAYEQRGSNGFGYDPIFFVPSYGMTTAELPPEEKNRISHRGKALKAMLDELALI
jgi:XTP/dITP diphosphohydrolase